VPVDDEGISGRPSTGITTENLAKVQEAIPEDRKRKIRDICDVSEPNVWNVTDNSVA
jgi:hypothetical protein